MYPASEWWQVLDHPDSVLLLIAMIVVWAKLITNDLEFVYTSSLLPYVSVSLFGLSARTLIYELVCTYPASLLPLIYYIYRMYSAAVEHERNQSCQG